MDPVIARLRERLEAEELSRPEAARLIGVTLTSLERHLAGEYVRSDSLAKYRRWLDGADESVRSTQLQLMPEEPKETTKTLQHDALATRKIVHDWAAPPRPHYVVDLFSGCGGLSLGFDVFGDHRAFKTVLALDIEEPMVRAFNDNFHASDNEQQLCRRIDLSDFQSEAEVLAFYLDHLAAVTGDAELKAALLVLPTGSLEDFRRSITHLDRAFLAELRCIRASDTFRAEYDKLDSVVLGQTSVIGFHHALGLPMPGTRTPVPAPLVWADTTRPPALAREDEAQIAQPLRSVRTRLQRRWETEIRQLQDKAGASGDGQLASSAKKIKAFLAFANSSPMGRIRAAWLDWRSRRDVLRSDMFGSAETTSALRRIYTPDRHAAVILGGPPCQGFSRIGRGKIRSLREHGVHAQVDAEAGDERNLLLLKYTLFVAALRPPVFLFENVRHFQAVVKTPEGTFNAPDVLAEAIRDISDQGAQYDVAMATVDCAKHLIPQTRDRFVMAGIRSDVMAAAGQPDLAKWVITLPNREAVSLRVALDGLPDPLVVSSSTGAELARTVDVHLDPKPHEDAVSLYLAWIRQSAPGLSGDHAAPTKAVDGHVVRAARADDQALFWLMGPGTRWMDYRCDRSQTLASLRTIVDVAVEAAKALRERKGGPRDSALARLANLDSDELEAVQRSVDGSLSLRLLLECVPPLPGELHHHLLTPGYMAKREGNHGDWLARMDGERPSKTIVSHMAKDTYMYVHPFAPRALSVREAARVQTFPDWFRLGSLGLVDAFRGVGNAVPPLLSHQFAERTAHILHAAAAAAGSSARQTG